MRLSSRNAIKLTRRIELARLDVVAQRQTLTCPGDFDTSAADQAFERVNLELDDAIVIFDRLAGEPHLDKLGSALANGIRAASFSTTR